MTTEEKKTYFTKKCEEYARKKQIRSGNIFLIYKSRVEQGIALTPNMLHHFVKFAHRDIGANEQVVYQHFSDLLVNPSETKATLEQFFS